MDGWMGWARVELAVQPPLRGEFWIILIYTTVRINLELYVHTLNWSIINKYSLKSSTGVLQ